MPRTYYAFDKSTIPMSQKSSLLSLVMEQRQGKGLPDPSRSLRKRPKHHNMDFYEHHGPVVRI